MTISKMYIAVGVLLAMAAVTMAISVQDAPVVPVSSDGNDILGEVEQQGPATGGPGMGDTNYDNMVDEDDLSSLLYHWGGRHGLIGWIEGNLDGDDTIDENDLSLLLDNWGPVPPSPPSAVPEPLTLIGVLSGSAGVAAYVRGRTSAARKQKAHSTSNRFQRRSDDTTETGKEVGMS